MEHIYILPLCKSVNHIYGITDKPYLRQYLLPQARAWKEEAVWLLKDQKNIQKAGTITKICHVRAWYYGLRSNQDSHNLIKLLCDALQDAGIIENDKLILWQEQERTDEADKKEVILRI